MLFQVLFKNDFFFKLTSDRHIKLVGLGGVILGSAVSMTSQSVLHMRKSISTSCKITFACEQEVQMEKIKEKTKTGALTLYTLSLIPVVYPSIPLSLIQYTCSPSMFTGSFYQAVT